MLFRMSFTRVKAAVLALAVAGVVGLGVGSASAAPVPLPANATLSTLIGLNASGGVLIGNFVYSDFSYSPSGTSPSNPTPGAGSVSVSTQSGSFGTNSGLTFSAGWESTPGANQDAVISYAIQAVSGTINEVALAFNGVALVPSAGTFASVTETISTLITSNNVAVGPGVTLGNLSIINTASSGIGTYSGPLMVNPGQTGLFVRKDVQLTSGTNGIASISFVDNTYLFASVGPIPEPASISTLSIAAVGLLARRRREQA
jgi:hypothetical protein